MAGVSALEPPTLSEIDKLVDKLLESAPWTVQYLVDLEPPDAGQLLERMRQKNANPWWTEWIDFYARTRKSPAG